MHRIAQKRQCQRTKTKRFRFVRSLFRIEERAGEKRDFRSLSVSTKRGAAALKFPHLADLVSCQSLLGHAARDSGQGQRTAHFRFKLTTLGTCGRVHPHRGVHQGKRVGQLLVQETEKKHHSFGELYQFLSRICWIV